MGPSHTKFSRNWNNKLDCNYFTTIRLYNPKKYEVGSVHEIWLNDVQIGRAQVVDQQMRTPQTLTETEAMLDAAMLKAELLKMLCRMYKRPEGAMLSLSFVTFKMVQRYEK